MTTLDVITFTHAPTNSSAGQRLTAKNFSVDYQYKIEIWFFISQSNKQEEYQWDPILSNETCWEKRPGKKSILPFKNENFEFCPWMTIIIVKKSTHRESACELMHFPLVDKTFWNLQKGRCPIKNWAWTQLLISMGL